jgi:aryl-alcohol dehydrogenase-like predicted oxidoreductase
MGMSDFYGAIDDDESVATIQRALDLGVTLFDTADIYGPHKNEVLVGRALGSRRDEAIVATKFGIVRDPSDPTKRGFNGRPEYVPRRATPPWLASGSSTSICTTSTGSTPTRR